MERSKSIFVFVFVFVFVLSSAFNVYAEGSERVKLLFAFGDSYADTGNSPIGESQAWKTPYGLTFPGKPSGRFSDGHVLTDYIASFVGTSSPVAYQLMKNSNTKRIREIGMNFAYGGTGVFTTLVDQPNMTTQIDLFQQLIHKNVYTALDLTSSVALVSLAGNDYAAYLARYRNFQGLPEFTSSVIEQLVVNIRGINGIGIKKIAVTGVGPLGCLPQNIGTNSYEICNADLNNFSEYHNQMLQDKILALNYEAAAPVYTYLDIYTAFTSALQLGQNPSGNELEKLKPCCMGNCGFVEKNGEKKYVVCENPSRSFFWDSIHPSNYGWAAVYSALRLSLLSLLL